MLQRLTLHRALAIRFEYMRKKLSCQNLEKEGFSRWRSKHWITHRRWFSKNIKQWQLISPPRKFTLPVLLLPPPPGVITAQKVRSLCSPSSSRLLLPRHQVIHHGRAPSLPRRRTRRSRTRKGDPFVIWTLLLFHRDASITNSLLNNTHVRDVAPNLFLFK